MYEIISDDLDTGLSYLTGLRIGVDGNLKSHVLKNLTVSNNFGVLEYKNGMARLAVKEGNFTFKILSTQLEDPISFGKKIFFICIFDKHFYRWFDFI